MPSASLSRLLACLLAVCGARLSADTVETKSGARIVGKVEKIDGGSVVVSTDYAGTITIKQSEVTSIVTAAPVAVRLASGTRVDGAVSGSAGAVQIAGAEGTVSTTVEKVAASWAAGGRDPAVVALDRGWAYEASVDVAGKSGNRASSAPRLACGLPWRASRTRSCSTPPTTAR